MSNLYQIQKLNDNNYGSWNVQMRLVLVQSELWPYVANGMPASLMNDTPEMANWVTKEAMAIGRILLSIEPTQFWYVKNCTTASEVWIRLKCVHRPMGPAQKLKAVNKLFEFKMKEGSRLTEHISAVNTLVENVRSVGVSISEELATCILLASLPSSFENAINVIESMDSLPRPSVLYANIDEDDNIVFEFS